MRDEVADIVFLDPPFNLGKQYGVRSSLENGDKVAYECYMKNLLRSLIKILRPGGALFLYHLPYWASRLSPTLHEELDFRHWIAISMKNSFARGKYLYPAHYALLYFTKGSPAAFVRPRITPTTCRHCGGYVKDYGGYLEIIREKGVNLADVWDDVSPVRHRSNKHRNLNELPSLITDRVVQIAGVEHGLLVDPFMGSGTSLVSAVAQGMHVLGNDLSAKALGITTRRLASLKPGSAFGSHGFKPL